MRPGLALLLVLSVVAASPPPPTCNRSPADLWVSPDGCMAYADVAPPPRPIPPPCIAGAQVARWREEGDQVLELLITVDHPELCSFCLGHIRLARYGDRRWTWIDIDAEPACAKDEGPLAWATLQILNRGDLAALQVYSAPLPLGYLDLLADLAGRQWHKWYLPFITQKGVTP